MDGQEPSTFVLNRAARVIVAQCGAEEVGAAPLPPCYTRPATMGGMLKQLNIAAACFAGISSLALAACLQVGPGDPGDGRRPERPPEAPTAAAVPGAPFTPGTPAGPAVKPTAAGRRPLAIGMNLEAPGSASYGWTFVDVFKSSSPWLSQRLDDDIWDDPDRPIRSDARGWPTLELGQVAATAMLADIEGHYPAGRYVCTYEGDGDLEFGSDARVASNSPGRIELDVARGDHGIFLRITRSNPANRVRDIHVWMPGFQNAASAFHPLYKERLAPFKVLRFLGWTLGITGNQTLARWGDRPTIASARQTTDAGVALEHIVDLCNELDAEPWLNMPHLADDEYVRQAATLVRGRLEPGRKVYVEFSNEVWNDGFVQARWINEQARLRGLEPPQVTADEAARDWRIWREVFGADAGRIVRVVAGHTWQPHIVEQIFDRLDGEADALACDLYFHPEYGPGDPPYTAATPVEEVMRDAARNLDEGNTYIRQYKQLADRWTARLKRPIQLVAYEGGPGMPDGAPGPDFGGTPLPYAAAYAAAQDRHPLMVQAYKRKIADFEQMGGTLYMPLEYVAGGKTSYGGWGHLEYQDQPIEQAVKYALLLDFMGLR